MSLSEERLVQTAGPYQGPYNPMLDPAYEFSKSTAEFGKLILDVANTYVRSWAELFHVSGVPLPRTFDLYRHYLNANGEMMARVTKEYQKPNFNLTQTQIGDRTVYVSEERVEGCELPFGHLIHFHRTNANRNDPKVLLVAPMSGHFATLVRPTVERLLPDHEVYVTDWYSAREVVPEAGQFRLDDYANYVRHFIGVLGPEVNVIALCQSTVPSIMAISRIAEDEPEKQPSTLTLMAGPLDVTAAPTKVTQLAERMNLEMYLQTFIGRTSNGRFVYPGYVQLASFIAMNPKRHFSSHRELYDYLVSDDTHPTKDRIERFYDEYFAVADLTAEFYEDTVKRIFMENQLAKGRLLYEGRPVRPDAINRCFVIGIEGEKDDISAVGQTKNALPWFTNAPNVAYYLQSHAGHYGVFSGGHWRNDIAPRVMHAIQQVAKECGRNYDDPTTPTLPIEMWDGSIVTAS